MNIGVVGQSFQAEFRKTDNALRDKARAKTGNADQSSFTPKAVDLNSNSGDVETVRAQINRTPDVREEKLAEVREKIRTGQYDDPDVIDHIAEALSKNIFVA
jgi:anti-sigma28 factor (negative regulator of flagellin synthesis)